MVIRIYLFSGQTLAAKKVIPVIPVDLIKYFVIILVDGAEITIDGEEIKEFCLEEK